MKYCTLLVFILSICLTYISSEISYKCAKDLKLKTCSMTKTDINGDITYYYKACSKGKFCEEDLTHSYSVCVKRKELLKEDKKCAIDEMHM